MTGSSNSMPEPDPYRLSLDDIDMSDARLFENDLAHRYFARMRKEAPVHFRANSAVGPFWSITKFDDILAVSRDHETFSADSAHGGHILGYETWFRDDPELQMPMMIAMDPPRHSLQRRAVSPAMAAPNVKKMEAEIRRNAGDILDALPNGETFNCV